MGKPGIARSFRFEQTLLRRLTREAGRQDTSTNALLSKIVRQYLDFGVFAEQYGMVSVNETEFTGLVDALSEEQLSRFVSAAAHSRPLEYFSWTGKETTVANLVEYLVVHVLRNCGFGSGEARFANGVWTVTMRAHGHGFVQWAKAYIPAVFREYHGIAPNIVTMNNTIQFTVADASHGKTKGPASTEIVATQ